MQEVYEDLFVGDDQSCSHNREGWAVVHACKHPCHLDAVGYTGNLSQDHPEYLIAPRETDLYLNIVDMERKLSHEYTEPIILAALDFIDDHLGSRQVLVHCNEGRSRSPSLAMLYLAKRAGVITDASYSEARSAFQELYPMYAPGRGIEAYLVDYWSDLA